MRSFACRNCSQLVFFENTACLNCEARLGFRWDDRELITLEPAEGRLRELGAPPGTPTLTRCANSGTAACNWLVARDGALCVSCELTSIRPADDDPSGLEEFRVAEAAKRRLVFELAELGLPVLARNRAGAIGGVAFELLSNRNGPVTTGHADGVITIDLTESDDARREERRQQLGEPYRTMLGHLRHEVGHYYWGVLASDERARERVRALFGDERDDYGAALERHYSTGPPFDWADRHVSAYATMHPAEDWAETFAHYLHIRDTLQTSAEFGVSVSGPALPRHGDRPADFSSEPTSAGDGFGEILEAWLPLTYALNAINRSMGNGDLYPFVLSQPVIEKLGVVHSLVVAQRDDYASSTSSLSASP